MLWLNISWISGRGFNSRNRGDTRDCSVANCTYVTRHLERKDGLKREWVFTYFFCFCINNNLTGQRKNGTRKIKCKWQDCDSVYVKEEYLFFAVFAWFNVQTLFVLRDFNLSIFILMQFKKITVTLLKRAKCCLAGMTVQWDAVGRRILLGDNTGIGVFVPFWSLDF
jgi:hypothetical protein